MPHLDELAQELGTSIIRLLGIAKQCGISHTPSDKDVEILKEKFSGYDGLSRGDKQNVLDFLEDNPRAKEILGSLIPLMSEIVKNEQEERRYLAEVSKRLYSAMDDNELKKKINPSTIYTTLLNLGVVQIYRGGAMPKKEILPSELIGFDREIVHGIIKKYFVDEITPLPLKCRLDAEYARKRIEDKRKYLLGRLKNE